MFTMNAVDSFDRAGKITLILCLLTVISQPVVKAGDSEPMRVFYPGQSTSSSSSGGGTSAPQYTPVVIPPIGGSGASNYAGNNSGSNNYSGGNSYAGGSNSYGGSGNNYSGGNNYGGSGGGGIRGAVGRFLGGPNGHLQSAMPNPATMPFQGGQSSADAEHQRVMENMRRAGYSDSRIKALDGYTHQAADPPGTTYRVINGIKVRNDGMTAGQAFENVINNGTMNTPIHADYRYYSKDEYGYYHNMGGKKTFAEWLKGQR